MYYRQSWPQWDWPQRSVTLAGAAGMTFALFFVMQMLIGQRIELPPTPPKPRDMPIIDHIELPKQPVRKELPARVPLPNVPNGIKIPVMAAPQEIDLPPVRPTGPVESPYELVPEGINDGGLLALVTAKPEYPVPAAMKGIEGYVLVEFTVTSLGKVRDARVIDGDQPGVFDRAALRAIERFRFKPRIFAGTAVDEKNVRYKFTFTLDK